MARSKRNRTSAPKHPWADTEVDESPFAHVTSDIVVRGRAPEPFLYADLSKDNVQKNRFLSSTTNLLILKGEAAASVIEVPKHPSARGKAIASRQRTEEELRRLHDELATLKAVLEERDAALARAARERPQAQAEMEWREQSSQTPAEPRDQADAAQTQASEQIRCLRDELEALRSTLADRESTLARAVSDHETARETWVQESSNSMASMEQTWRAAEAARLAEAQAEWSKQNEQSLAEAQALVEAARDEAKRETQSLRNEISALESTLAEHEAAIAKAVTDHDLARSSWQQESMTALSNAQQAWKLAETARLAEAEAEWQRNSAEALGALRAEAGREAQTALARAEQACAAAEASRLASAEARWQEQSTQTLNALRAEFEAARHSADETIHSLKEQISATQASLAEREAALAQSVQDIERTRDQARQELDAVLAKTKTWQAEEGQRLAEAEARWKQQSASALAEAQARYQAAEGALVQLRLEADRARSAAVGGSITGSSVKSGDRSAFGTKPVAHEPVQSIQLPTRETRGHGTPQGQKIVLQPHRPLEAQGSETPRKRGMLRDMVVVAMLATAAIVAYPRIEPLIPEPWRSNLAALMGSSTRNAIAQVSTGSATVVRDVNLRVGPSITAGILEILPRGLKVSTITRRDDWIFVEVAPDVRNPQTRRGWVNNSFVRDGTIRIDDDAETEPVDDTE